MKEFTRVLCVLFLLHPTIGNAEDSLSLAIGEQKSIPIEAESRFSVGNPEVIKARATQIEGGKSLLLIKGKSQGYSDLVILGADGVRRSLSFRVYTKKQAAMAQDGHALLKPDSGLRFESQGQGWIV